MLSISYSQTANFHGQQAMVKEIHQHLCHGPTKSSALELVALCSLEGSGKTQLALGHLYGYRDSYGA